jgi:pyruvate dehydrogenase E1 component alpha subunit
LSAPAKLGASKSAVHVNGPGVDADARSLQDRVAAYSRSAEERDTLGALADPALFTDAVDTEGWPGEDLRRLLSSMLTVRSTEEQLGRMVESGEVVCPVHLAIGQEAVPVGVSCHLTPDDRVFGAHRSHGHYLALGGDVYRLIAEALGRAEGCSGGMGGSMHLYAPEVGFKGSVPIVAATVPIAVGAALAAKKDGKGAVAVAYFGDGAAEEGAVHESLNLASHMQLPVLFVCENNLYASHMDIAQRQPSDRTGRFADAAGVNALAIDGNDVIRVADAAGSLIEAARRGAGPGYLEAVTYRWRGHVGPDENIDVGLRRSRSELAAWRKRDPVSRLASAMIRRGDISKLEIERLRESIDTRVAGAADRARKAPYPDGDALLDFVFGGPGN